MGVAGAGKTTVGSLLAERLGWEFVDADSFHSKANVEKIMQGIALDDADREPWLEGIRAAELRWVAEGRKVVLACSALKRAYRKKLNVGPAVKFVYLKGNREVIASRLRGRQGHFAGEQLLAGQLAALEEPENAIVIDVGKSPEEIVTEIVIRLRSDGWIQSTDWVLI